MPCHYVNKVIKTSESSRGRLDDICAALPPVGVVVDTISVVVVVDIISSCSVIPPSSSSGSVDIIPAGISSSSNNIPANQKVNDFLKVAD